MREIVQARALERRLQVSGQGVQGVGVVPDLHVPGVGLATTRTEGPLTPAGRRRQAPHGTDRAVARGGRGDGRSARNVWAVQAVRSEPFSGSARPDSLLYRENTGKFADAIAPSAAQGERIRANSTSEGASARIFEQGITGKYQGMDRPAVRTGKSSTVDGIFGNHRRRPVGLPRTPAPIVSAYGSLHQPTRTSFAIATARALGAAAKSDGQQKAHFKVGPKCKSARIT